MITKFFTKRLYLIIGAIASVANLIDAQTSIANPFVFNDNRLATTYSLNIASSRDIGIYSKNLMTNSDTCLIPSVGGVVSLTSGVLPLCTGTNVGTLSLTGQVGGVVKWQTSTNGGTSWTDISNTLNSYDFTNAVDNQAFRVVVNSGGTCLDAYSLSLPVTVSPIACPCLTPSVGGILGLTSGVLPLASPLNSGTLGVLGQVGNILKWQTSTDGGTSWTDIANTTANYDFTDVAHNQLFRTVVNSGGSCTDAYSSSVTLTTLGVNCSCLVPSVGGSVALTTGVLPLCSTSNSGTLGLVGNMGSILKWQTSTNGGSSWTDISNTSNSLDFTNALNNQQYRAVVNNGAACGNVNSLPFVIVLSPLSCPCLTPSVGGVVALTSGVLPLCAPLNTAEISLTGQVGNIAKWQTSTDGGTTWTDVSNTTASYNINNAANNQQFRAVVNAGGSCKDAYSASVALTVSPIACPCLIPSVGGAVNLTVGILPFPTPLNTGVLSLTGQIGNISKWQTSTDGGTTWTDIANTTASYSFANASNNQQYRAVVNNGGACGDAFSSSTSITVTGSAFPCLVPSIGGIAALTSGILPLCSSSNSGTVSLVGHIGNIVKWQTSTNGGSSWADISNTTASYNFTNAVNNQLYRAVVNNGGVCGDAYSISATILVSSLACPCLIPSVGGVVALTSGVLPLCAPLNIGTISLTGQIGNIAKWQTSTNGGATWTNIANTTASYDFSNAADNQQYRVVMNNGGSCLDAYSLNIALPVSPLSCPCLTPSVGGIVNLASGLLLPLSSPLNGGNLNMIGQIGAVSKWQTSTDGGSTWSDIANTLPSYNFTNALNNQQYRAVVNNGGACTDAYSAGIPITITQPTCPCLTPSVGGITVLTNGSLPLCSTANTGTVGLTGQVGNTVKWQISLDLGLTWTDVAANTVSHTFANALNGQFIRSIVNNGSGCLDAPSVFLVIPTIISACIEIVNGIDDDGNGLTDCADPNCITKAVAPGLIKRN